MPVELSADPAITVIELTLDGAPAGRLAGPPFKGEVDLGPSLLPHHLEARGLAVTGANVAGTDAARAEQWLNLPQPAATVDLAPETDGNGRIAAVRLAFRSLTHEKPKRVTATLDGAPLAVVHGRVALPDYKPDRPHLLSIEARFPAGLTARRDLGFGGGLEGEVATELTAVPLRSRGPLPPAAVFSGWFEAGGRPLATSAVEEGPGEILVVRDPLAPPSVVEIGERASHDQKLDLLHFELPLKPQDRLRFLSTVETRFAGDGGGTGLFDVSQELDGKKAGLYWRLAFGGMTGVEGPPHLVDAVAVAGLHALAGNHRRAVLLVLSGKTADASRHDAQAVRRYLNAIRVPLYVWSLVPPPYPAAVAAWGQVEDVSTLAQMRRAYGRLGRDLASQRIVWLHGRHLPQSIALTEAAPRSAELVAGPGR
ncbi:MAG TPA: hypothetical protein VFE33_04090 [Thermoanaerobaculia bacterium]|nr:hypothetical protein [Thermoanaerobaculia bacterium]